MTTLQKLQASARKEYWNGKYSDCTEGTITRLIRDTYLAALEAVEEGVPELEVPKGHEDQAELGRIIGINDVRVKLKAHIAQLRSQSDS